MFGSGNKERILLSAFSVRGVQKRAFLIKPTGLWGVTRSRFVKIRIACFANLLLEYHHIFKQTLLEFISRYGAVQNSFNKHSLAAGNESVFVTNDVCIILTLLILGICGGAASNHPSTTAHLPCMLIRKTLFPLDVGNTAGYTRGHAQRISVT